MNCVLKALSQALSVPTSTLSDKIGFTGDEILFPEFEEPYNKRSITIHDVIKCAYEYGWAVIVLSNPAMNITKHKTWIQDTNMLELASYGIACGMVNGYHHAEFFSDFKNQDEEFEKITYFLQFEKIESKK